jgi:hypothetical protein
MENRDRHIQHEQLTMRRPPPNRSFQSPLDCSLASVSRRSPAVKRG